MCLSIAVYMIKALFFDIDGTLVSFRDHTIPESARRALEQLKKRGVRLFVASGRHPADILSICDFPFDGYVALNGGYCAVGRDEVVARRFIPDDDIERLIRWQQGAHPFACVLAGEREMYLNFVDERVTRVRELVQSAQPARVVSPEQWNEAARRGVLQLIAFFGAEEEERILTEVLPGCHSMRWNPLFADIVPAGVDKAEGIDRVLSWVGIAPEGDDGVRRRRKRYSDASSCRSGRRNGQCRPDGASSGGLCDDIGRRGWNCACVAAFRTARLTDADWGKKIGRWFPA